MEVNLKEKTDLTRFCDVLRLVIVFPSDEAITDRHIVVERCIDTKTVEYRRNGA